MKKKFLLLSFIEGAAVMAAELCGAKLLAPVFGSSLFVWASVMGVTLAALAGGYFFGGYMSFRKSDKNKLLFQMLNIASICILLMPVLAYYLVPRISYLPFSPGVILSTIVLVFFPIFFLGTTSPVFITLQSIKSGEEGKVSGTVYAISTLGGILATFLSGFYLVPLLGLNLCLLVFGSVLFFTNLLVFKLIKTTSVFIWIAVIYLNLQFKINEGKSVYNRDGIYGNLKVEDVKMDDKTVRYLKTNEIPQTEMDLSTGKSVSLYVTILDSIIPYGAGKKALLLGLGGGLLANVLADKNYVTDAVELDDRIIETAKQFFNLNKHVTTFHQDARYYMNHCESKYDAVVIDIYRGEEPPSHVLTTESLERLKQNLNQGALVYINWHGYLNGEIGLGTSILYHTLVKSGFDLKLCTASTDQAHRNLIFVASLGHLPQQAFQTNELLSTTELVNTDNKPLLEKYNALATKAWRSNYLRYYQSTTN